MSELTREFDRRQFLKVAGIAAAAVGVGGIAAACSPAASVGPSAAAGTPAPGASGPAPSAVAGASNPTGTFNWMTWVDHYYPEQLATIESTMGISTNLTELADNADGYTKLKEVGGQLDMISGDA